MNLDSLRHNNLLREQASLLNRLATGKPPLSGAEARKFLRLSPDGREALARAKGQSISGRGIAEALARELKAKTMHRPEANDDELRRARFVDGNGEWHFKHLPPNTDEFNAYFQQNFEDCIEELRRSVNNPSPEEDAWALERKRCVLEALDRSAKQ